MSANIARVAVLLVLGALASNLSGCKPGGHWTWFAEPTATPEPVTPATPTPSPTPIYIPQKRMETAKLFNGMKVQTTLESEPGTTASDEVNTPSSYSLELTVKVKVPKANADLAALSKINDALPNVLPNLPALLPSARIAPSYEALYARKLALLQRQLVRLDQLITRHNFFDCETILELQNPQTKRTALLLQTDMDVDTDGSDSDRLPAVDANSSTFQPMTSYRWPKRTPIPSPFLPSRMARLRALETELLQAKGLGAARLQALRDTVGAARYEVNQLRTNSFLMSATDPYIVLPGLMMEGSTAEFTPHVGDYCVVIFGDTLYPAVVGDIGPNDKVGEASLRIASEINPTASADIRAVNLLKATYLVFPNSADKPFGPPDLDRWHAKVDALLKDFGGYNGKLLAWKEISKPAPLPTPTPSATPPPPTPAPSQSPGGPSPSVSPQPSAPQGSPTAQPSPSSSNPSATPPGTPSATPTAQPSESPAAVELPITAQLKKPHGTGSSAAGQNE